MNRLVVVRRVRVCTAEIMCSTAHYGRLGQPVPLKDIATMLVTACTDYQPRAEASSSEGCRITAQNATNQSI